MNTDVAGRVRNVPMPISKPLLPLFEAIVNSIQAIEDAKTNDGIIEIEIVREKGLFDSMDERSMAEITDFVIKDNGIGFDEENFIAFSTSDTTYKAKRGGKGIGRFMWLSAFDSVDIESVFDSSGVSKRRRFTFCTRGDGIENPICTDAPNENRGTKITLKGMKEKLRKTCPKKLETIAVFIIEEFLEYYIHPDPPNIVLRDALTGEVLHLDNFFESEMKANSSKTSFKIGKERFNVLNVRLYTTHLNEHQLSLCAHERVVSTERLAGRIPNLSRRLEDENNKKFIYAAYVTSPALDAVVNAERTGFNMSENSLAILPAELSLGEIRKAVDDECKKYLAPYTVTVAKAKKDRIERYVETEGAMYRPILKHLASKIDDIEPEASDDEIDKQLYDAYHDLQVQLRSEGKQLLKSVSVSSDVEFERFKDQFDEYFEKISEVNRSDLARYVCHRKAIIEFLQQQLAVQDDGKYRREDRIHSIIFPRGKTSDDLLFEDHNLWLVDERLAFHVYLSSDQSIRQAKPLQNDSKREPDILVFDKAVAFSETTEVPFNSITIIEFKRPQRNEYTDDENPFTQVFGYIDDIKAGKARTSDGRALEVPKNLPFYCYIVCDKTTKLREWARHFNFKETPDGLGYFLHHDNYGAYCEVISYAKLLSDAEKRNQAFFRKLQLPKRISQ